MRIYVLITSIRPLKIYMFKDGIVRFSTEKYNKGNLGNKFSHLTNTSINKYSPSVNVVKNVIGAGSKWSLDQLHYQLTSKGCDVDYLWFKIK